MLFQFSLTKGKDSQTLKDMMLWMNMEVRIECSGPEITQNTRTIRTSLKRNSSKTLLRVFCVIIVVSLSALAPRLDLKIEFRFSEFVCRYCFFFLQYSFCS
mmetsp:Transcript_22442/g.62505  ORF Transcript_22442/g.62505 Transcript_22442/m.62505 type:complete len:101 (+) Transcript_22442:305-607(+)